MNIVKKCLNRIRYRVKDYKTCNLYHLGEYEKAISKVKKFSDDNNLENIARSIRILKSKKGTSYETITVPACEALFQHFVDILYQSDSLMRLDGLDKKWVVYSFELPPELRAKNKELMFLVRSATEPYLSSRNYLYQEKLRSIKLGKDGGVWIKNLQHISQKWDMYAKSEDKYVVISYFLEIYSAFEKYYTVLEKISEIKKIAKEN